jgi:hypothetical protein
MLVLFSNLFDEAKSWHDMGVQNCKLDKRYLYTYVPALIIPCVNNCSCYNRAVLIIIVQVSAMHVPVRIFTHFMILLCCHTAKTAKYLA